MKYRLISVGKIQEPFYAAGINEYLKRLKPYVKIDMIMGLEEKTHPKASQKDLEKVVLKEGERILNLIGENQLVVLLDIQGKPLDSVYWAEQITKWNNSGTSVVNLIVGGSYGVSAQVKQRADYIFSFSQMTFPHQMAVLILVEQIYRGFKIILKEPYHK